MDSVYISNFGQRNSLWPQAKAHSTILTLDDVVLHDFWRSGDRSGYIEAAIVGTKTVLGMPPTRPTAGRWFNLMEELRDTEGDVWITRQGDDLWWTVSLAGELLEARRPDSLRDSDGTDAWVIEKPCRTWSDRDQEGRSLKWSALHPKARDFLSTEATFQKLGNDRGYADYARALVAGEPLDLWHRSTIFADKASQAKRSGTRIYSPKEIAAARMAMTVLDTVLCANGQLVERRVKEKTTTLSRQEWETLILQMMGEQEDRCILTGLPLGYDRECEDKEMLASLDRIDSARHYTPDNVQLVCRFVNRWKGADDDTLVRHLLSVLRLHHQRQ